MTVVNGVHYGSAKFVPLKFPNCEVESLRSCDNPRTSIFGGNISPQGGQEGDKNIVKAFVVQFDLYGGEYISEIQINDNSNLRPKLPSQWQENQSKLK